MPARALGSALCAGLLSLLALLAAPAGAASYCVLPASGCELSRATFAEALTASGATPAADTIRLGSATYAENGLEYVGTSAVSIEGAGAPATTIERASGEGIVLKIDTTAAVEIARLRIRETGLAGVSGLTTSGSGGGIIDSVEIDGEAGVANVAGARLGDGWTLRNSTVDLPKNSCVEVTANVAAPARIEDSTLRNCQFGFNAQGSGLIAQRLRIRGTEFGASFGGGAQGRLEDSLLTGVEIGIFLSTSGPLQTTKAVVKQSTLIGAGAGTYGVECFNHLSTAAGTSLILEDSILREFENTLIADAEATKPCSVLADYNDYDEATKKLIGAGTITSTNQTNLDPLFVDAAAGDYRLKAASPLIDRDPRPLEAGESATDLAGNPRISGGGRDLGAFELQVPPPLTPGNPGDPGTPATPTAPGTPPAGQALKASAGRLVPVKAGKAELTLRCPGTLACAGVARFTARIANANGRMNRRFLGQARYTVAAGASKVVKVRLTRNARTALEAAPGKRLQAQLAGRGTANRGVLLRFKG